LSIEDQLLIALEYWRGGGASPAPVSIALIFTLVSHRIEDKLVKTKKFSLPGKKALVSTKTEWEVVIVDVEESPSERPKKASA
jgi:hypothetical protein